MPLYPATEESWRLARLLIAEGGLVAFPTDTVYGVACDPYNTAAIERLYSAKGRDREKALPLLLDSPDRIAQVAAAMPVGAWKLAHAFWPGALTLVVPRHETLPAELGGGDTIAVRVPDHLELRSFIASCGGALATSSANLSGRPDAATARQVDEYFGEAVRVVIDGGVAPGGTPSTVVSCLTDPPKVLRQGAIAAARIEAVHLEP